MAAFARKLPDMFRNLKKHQMANHKVALPHLTTWYALYRNHNRYCDPFLNMVLESSELAAKLVAFSAAVNELSQRKDDVANYRLTERIFLREAVLGPSPDSIIRRYAFRFRKSAASRPLKISGDYQRLA
jgi:hypothetical protein